jgi:benzoyl-CoA reductase subunit B
MIKQKEMMADHYERLSSAPETGAKVCSTFVPGNLNELIMCFDLLNNLPEVNAIQAGLRRKSGSFVLEAEKAGHSEDVCTYVKSDLGMMAKGNIGPNGKKLPDPNVLLLSYTGCFTFMKWFELLREQYKCPTIMMHTPYMGDGKITPNMIEYMVKQLKEVVIPELERVSGVKFDIDRLREYLKKSSAAEDDLVWVLQSAKNKPSPIDAYFGGIYYIGPIFGAFRGTDDAIDYYRFLRAEVEERVAQGIGPVTPEGPMGKERYRLVVEGPPNYTNFRQFWKMFYDDGAVVVASSYSKVGGTYDFGFRHDPSKPLETLAEYCLGVYTNRSLPMRVDMLSRYVEEYEADGLLINSIKSCNSFSAGQLLIMREVEKRTGKPAAFIETDLVDPRYFSAANVKNRLESYFQMIEQKRGGARAPTQLGSMRHEDVPRHRSRLDHHQGGGPRRERLGDRPRHHQLAFELRHRLPGGERRGGHRRPLHAVPPRVGERPRGGRARRRFPRRAGAGLPPGAVPRPARRSRANLPDACRRRALREGRRWGEGGGRGGVPAASRRGPGALRTRRQTQVGLLPRSRRIALSDHCRGRRARRRRALQPGGQRLRQVDYRGGEPAAGGGSAGEVSPRARPPAGRRWSHGAEVATCRVPSSGRSASSLRTPGTSEPVTVG